MNKPRTILSLDFPNNQPPLLEFRSISLCHTSQFLYDIPRQHFQCQVQLLSYLQTFRSVLLLIFVVLSYSLLRLSSHTPFRLFRHRQLNRRVLRAHGILHDQTVQTYLTFYLQIDHRHSFQAKHMRLLFRAQFLQTKRLSNFHFQISFLDISSEFLTTHFVFASLIIRQIVVLS